MARIRSVKPEFWSDLKLARLSRDARLLYIALWNQADEWARMPADVRFIKGHCLPYDDDLSLRDIDRLLVELGRADRIRRYVVDGQPFLTLPKLSQHQRLEPSKVPSRLPAPPSGDFDGPGNPSEQARWMNSDVRADESAPSAESSETNCALHVAGSMEHGAGSRGLSTSVRTRGRKPATTDDPAFDEFWQAYPRRQAKGAAQRAFRKALRHVSADTLIAGARRLAADPTLDPKFCPHAATWLNDGRWDDEGPARPASVQPNAADERTNRNLALVRAFAELEGAPTHYEQPEIGA